MGSIYDLTYALDVLGRLVRLLNDLLYGPGYRFVLERQPEWSGGDIRRLLQRHGRDSIRIWGLGITSRRLYFSVKRSEAEEATMIMWREGIWVANPPATLGEGKQERSLPGAPLRAPFSALAWQQAAGRQRKPRQQRSWLDDVLALLGLA